MSNETKNDEERDCEPEKVSKEEIDMGRRAVLKTAAVSTTAAVAAGALHTGVAKAYDAPAAVQKSLEKPGRVRLPFGQAERNWLANIANWYEFPTNDPEILEVWGYTDKLSYKPGDEIELHVNATASTYKIEIFRDGGEWESVYKQDGVSGTYHDTPIDCYEKGCGWPVSAKIPIPNNWKSGAYVVILSAEKDEQHVEQEAFFILRAAQPGSKNKILFLPAVPTWIAYNDWAGGCSYRLPPEAGGGGREGRGSNISIRNSIHQPWARGFIRLPVVAENSAQKTRSYDDRPIGWEPAYPHFDYVFANGYSMFCPISGWAAYDRHFAVWAEQSGYEIDYATPHDILDSPDLLENYKVIVQVGHDEYHTFEYREAVDKFTKNGGRVVRTAGNILWQVRMEGNQQVFYGGANYRDDPLYADPTTRERTAYGFHVVDTTNNPPVTTWGVNGHKGIYANTGGITPRGSGGFTVYRNKHWVFEGTDFYYGDVLGGSMTTPLVGFEIDGVDYTFRHGLPYPTGEDGAPKDLEILALAPGAQAEEIDHGHPVGIYFYGDTYADARELASDLNLEPTPENLEKLIYGNAAITYMKKGQGEVFAAGTCNWVIGLLERDPFVERLTKNVLDRFSS